MENEQIRQDEYEVYEEKAKFIQTITRDDIIHFNDYLFEKRAKNSIFTKIIGAFFIVLGVMNLVTSITEKNYNAFGMAVDILTIIMGVLFIFVLGPVTLKMQKKTIRKRIGEDFKSMVMRVIVHTEGIGFEMLEDEQPEEIIDTVSVDEQETEELTNEQARELEYEESSNIEEVEATNDDPNNPNVFTIPWGGITKIEDDGEFMFINMIGYQALLIKKADYNEIDDVVAFAKEMLQDPKRYVEINIKNMPTK